MSVRSPVVIRESLQDWVPAKKLHFHRDWPNATTAGGWNANGQLNHWTAMSKRVSVQRQVEVLRYGYSGLPGPLCFGSPTFNGHLWIIGWGNTNHAGMGDREVFNRIVASRFDGTPVANDESIDGNARLYGWECQFHPDDGVFSDEMLEVNILGAAAVAEAHGWSPKDAALSMADHYEWAARKWDREVQNLANRSRDLLETYMRRGPNRGGGPAPAPLDGFDELMGDLNRMFDTRAEFGEFIRQQVSNAEMNRAVNKENGDTVTLKWGYWNLERRLHEITQTPMIKNEIRPATTWMAKQTRQDLRELSEQLANAAEVLGQKIHDDPAITDEQANEMVSEIVTGVDRLRVTVERDMVDEEETS